VGLFWFIFPALHKGDMFYSDADALCNLEPAFSDQTMCYFNERHVRSETLKVYFVVQRKAAMLDLEIPTCSRIDGPRPAANHIPQSGGVILHGQKSFVGGRRDLGDGGRDVHIVFGIQLRHTTFYVCYSLQDVLVHTE